MPKVTIDTLTSEDGRILVLLTPRMLAQKAAFARDRRREAQKIAERGLAAEALQAELEADAVEAQLAEDAAFREAHRDRIKSYIFVFREPTLADQREILKVQRESDPMTAREAALDRLAPSCPEWDGPVKLAVQNILADECYAEVFYDLETQRRVFTTSCSAH